MNIHFKILVFALFSFSMAQADEGMWTLNSFPTEKVKEAYGFTATPEWLDHVRLSSARLAGGCSASFVSANGLVMTNHHCAHSCIEQLSKEGKDFVASGFYAKNESDEVKCPEIEVNRLTSISDVTDRINKATAGLDGKPFNDAQKGEMSKIEKECSAGSDTTRCDVVTLFHGGHFDLYKYQRYQDVRLVFAPELATAFFGGDPDNFMFPRFDLDVSFLRVYEQGKPLKNDQFFKWSSLPAQENDLTFVTGHPGRTSRLLTVSELLFQRDISLVHSLIFNSELRGFLTEYGAQGAEQRRISEAKLFGVENGIKAWKGKREALIDPKFFAKKEAEEQALRKKIASKPKWKKEYGTAWDEVAKAQDELKQIYIPLTYLENNRNMNSKLYALSKVLVRAGDELAKPNEKRFREFADSNLPQIKQDLFSTAPIYDEFEIEMMTFSLTKMREALTANHPFIKKLFGQKSPREIAESLVKGTKLKDLKVREELFKGGKAAIDASSDPFIVFAKALDEPARAYRKKYEDEIESVVKKNSEKIAKAYFAVNGSNTYPDATFTLRVSYGQIKGYDENGGHVTPITTLAGAFDRHTGREPFALPQTWLKAKSDLKLDTPLNFCSTNDIIGGNSGSPVVNKDAEIVGLIFDGNIQSLGGDYGFDPAVNRAVAVHSAGILEVLKKVYGADRIVNDIQGTRQHD
jgi:V8-like Glu-specific endopeptidase